MKSNKEELKNIVKHQEIDRQRIANDLHDTSLQTLAHLTHQIELASLYIDKDTVRAKLELAEVNKELREVIDEIRATIFDLRPMTFDDIGLKEAIERDIANVDNHYHHNSHHNNINSYWALAMCQVWSWHLC